MLVCLLQATKWKVMRFHQPTLKNFLHQALYFFFFQLLRGRWRTIGRQWRVHGHLQSFSEARCKLPFPFPRARKLRGLPLRILVSVSNNRVLKSNKLKLVIYDSACHRCLASGLCWRKVNLRVSKIANEERYFFLLSLHSRKCQSRRLKVTFGR